MTAALAVGSGPTIAPPPVAAAQPVQRVQPVRSADEAPYVMRSSVIGHSVKGRPIRAWYRGTKDAPRVLLVLGQMHGDEPAGPITARWMIDHIKPLTGTGLWVIPTINPDGRARRTRKNARGVDLNRNWPTSGWSRSSGGDRSAGGPRPASEPETRALMNFLRNVKPDFIASIHQPLYGIGKSHLGIAYQRRLAANLGLPRRSFGVGNPTGTVSPTMTGWYQARLGDNGVAITIEYGARPSTYFTTVRAGRGIARAGLIR